jgi:hypothetical protein
MTLKNSSLLKILVFLNLMLFAWAIVFTNKFYELKKNPVVMTPTTNLASLDQISSLEKVNFLRQFSDKFLNYNSQNFWQSQLALTSLMGASLQEERKNEIQRLKSAIENKSFAQKSELISIASTNPDNYQAIFDIISEESGKAQNFRIQIHYSIESTTRTIENPWGLIISALKISKQPSIVQDPSAITLSLNHDNPVLLNFPCQVENIEIPNQSALSFKLTTLNTTEVQVIRKNKIDQKLSAKARCRNGFFIFEILPVGDVQTLFLNFNSNWIKQEHQAKKSNHPKPKSQVQKTVEEELGFVIDESQ